MSILNKNPRTLLVVGVVIFVLTLFMLAAVVLAGSCYWRGRPEYSLNQIRVAVRTHDLALFRKHVDMKAISSRLVDDLAAKIARDKDVSLGTGLIGLLKPQLAVLFESEVERYVETGSFPPDAQQKFDGENTQTIINRLGDYEWAEIDGSVAQTWITVQPRSEKEKPVRIGLKLRRTGDGYWQLMEVSLPENLRQELPAKRTGL